MFGESAALAHRSASPRLLRWCQAMADWLAERQCKCRTSTSDHSRLVWQRFLSHCPRSPWEVTSVDLQAHVDWLTQQGFAPTTIHTELGYLSNFYEWCSQHAVDPACGTDFNPLADFPRPEFERYANVKLLSRAQVDALLSFMQRDESNLGRRDYAFILARLSLGVTLQTLQQLQWGQLEQDETGLWLRRGSDGERLPLPEPVWQAIMAYLQASGRLEGLSPQDYIFAPLQDVVKREASGQPQSWDHRHFLSNWRIMTNLRKYGQLVGIPDELLTLRNLRHTAVRLRQEAGDSLEQIHAFLGRKANLADTKRYLRRLPPLPPDEGYPAGERPAGGQSQTLPLPARKPKFFESEDFFLHGLYAASQPAEQVAAILAQDLQGFEAEFIGLRLLSRQLLAALGAATGRDAVALLGDAYTLTAARLAELRKLRAEQAEPDKDQEWVSQVLKIVDEFWALDHDTGAAGQELPSQEFWRTLAQGDPGSQAASSRLKEEIASTRLVLWRLYDLATQTQDVADLVRFVNHYGKGCKRLALLLKAEQGPHTNTADALRELLIDVILEVNQEFGLDLNS